jgi:competence protein ComEA
MRSLFKGLTVAALTLLPLSASASVALNQASAEELTQLHGVGSVLAERIVDYRKSHDGFGSVEELVEVKGIGDKTLADLKDQVALGE